jgi:hypothetical protein
MKQRIGTLVLAGIICMVASGSALAGTYSPRIDQRQINQERRIQQGVNSGRLTPREAGRLQAQQARIEHREARMKADGYFSPAERRRLSHQQYRASRNIYHKKHNLRYAHFR